MKFTTSQKMITLLTSVILFSGVLAQATVPQSVKNIVESRVDSSIIEVLLSFDNDLDLAAVKMTSMKKKQSRVETYYEVMNRLENNRKNLENQIAPLLTNMQAEGSIESFRFFTVSKTVLVRTRVDNIDNLTALPGVELINLNSKVSLIEPVENTDAEKSPSLVISNSSLQALNVSALWAQGYTGEGSVICSFDTGVDGDHPMLSSKWRGNNGGSASSHWFAPRGDSLPYDNLGHGSHTMGVMVGSTDTDTIGVAPGAQWISAAVIDQGANFSTTIADILDAFEWALNPDGDINTTNDVPDVINSSWGVPNTIYDECNNTFWTAIDNVEAAGIVTIFAAGNEGPNPSTIRNPADRASSPLNAMSVGAVDALTETVADFSSRGPSICNGAIKPEIVAPGVSIYSSYKDGGYKSMSGTSMAAPFISGIVALMRQYNPEATVEQIKNALISAARDLGPLGEDNAYGHGIVDAARVLEFLPAPTTPQIYVVSHQVNADGDSFADPGEDADITLTLRESTKQVSAVDVWLTSGSSSITISNDTIRFTFDGGSDFALSPYPFALSVSDSAISGKSVIIDVNIQIPGSAEFDTRTISLMIGHVAPGRIFTSTGNSLTISASEFGQYGFGTGSIYQAGGEGFRFNSSSNLLYEGGLILARSPQMVSDGIRDSLGLFKESNFMPSAGNDIQEIAASNEVVVAKFTDGDATLPIPVTVEQTIWTSDENFTIIEFEFTNPMPERLDRLAAGLFFDFDMDSQGDMIGFDTLMGLLYQYDASENMYVGIIGLSTGDFNFTAGTNGDSKVGFTTASKFGLANTQGIQLSGSGTADWYFTASQIYGGLDAFGNTKFTVALVAANNLNELRQAAEAALSDYGAYLDVDDVITSLPTEMELSQNYPNPFNPRTTIQFALKAAQHVTLEVYNITGQRVKTLFDDFALAGQNSVEWDGNDNYGQQTASGVYFYRLTSENGMSSTKKMILLK
ncbi:MAG: S8 family peptidase [candidate division Zixibacteria bacterium]|nr:S8 family peptidase [candidate division Zixibacteria bacterium]